MNGLHSIKEDGLGTPLPIETHSVYPTKHKTLRVKAHCWQALQVSQTITGEEREEAQNRTSGGAEETFF